MIQKLTLIFFLLPGLRRRSRNPNSARRPLVARWSLAGSDSSEHWRIAGYLDKWSTSSPQPPSRHSWTFWTWTALSSLLRSPWQRSWNRAFQHPNYKTHPGISTVSSSEKEKRSHNSLPTSPTSVSRNLCVLTLNQSRDPF